MPIPAGEGWLQISELALALVLTGLIGLEREFRQKSAGLRTHTLVGVGAALFMLVSKYGFTDVLSRGTVVLDPSRVAAQIVTGIGFLGAGLIFVRRDSVRGLTTAAGVWLAAAVGATAGSGLWVLALAATAIYFIVAMLFPLLSRAVPRSSTAISLVRVRYPDGQGRLRQLLQVATNHGFGIDEVSAAEPRPATEPGAPPTVEVALHVHGSHPVAELAATLSEMESVEAFVGDDANAVID
ncbi:MAG: MgtC/SapB family protein [Candidatus Dormibacteraceae bacterium]